MRARSFLLVAGFPLALALVEACGSSNGASDAGAGGAPASTGSASGSASGGAGGAGGGGSDAGDDGLFVDHGKIVSIAIDPPSAALVVKSGSVPVQQFNAIATYADQFKAGISASWSFDHAEIGLVTPGAGLFTPSGLTGGKGTITATASGQSATAIVTVSLLSVDNPASLTPQQIAGFDTPDMTPSGTLLYPYDKTVFARGIVAPALMWSGGAAGDTYYIHLKEAYFEAKIYASADPPSDFTMSDDVWSKLAASNAGEDVSVDVERASANQAHAAMHETWTIAQGSLRGSIYYWAVNTGQLMKIAPGAKAPTVAFDSGPADQLGAPAPAGYNNTMPPWESGGNNKRCVACHTVSKDGSTISAIFEKTGSTASPWGTVDLTASPASVVQMAPYTSQAIYTALTPDGSSCVYNNVDFTMHIADSKTGAPIASALDSVADKIADPAFSPDGKLFAFSSQVTGSYPVEFTRADLDVFDFDPVLKTFSNRRNVVSGGMQAIAFPSFSPDSAWIFYQRGDYSRAKYGASSVGHDDLYVADVAGSVGEVGLAAASGAGLDAKNQHINYQPTVNPISVGGYSWVVFVSPRDYGNKMASQSNPTYENRKQLWVAAVDSNPKPGVDPSHPAFWLGGQDLTTINMSGYWALEPCKQTGNSCEQGFECCTGYCHADMNGNAVCVDLPSGCSSTGDKCTKDSDCCNGSDKCSGGFCASGPPN